MKRGLVDAQIEAFIDFVYLDLLRITFRAWPAAAAAWKGRKAARSEKGRGSQPRKGRRLSSSKLSIKVCFSAAAESKNATLSL